MYAHTQGHESRKEERGVGKMGDRTPVASTGQVGSGTQDEDEIAAQQNKSSKLIQAFHLCSKHGMLHTLHSVILDRHGRSISSRIYQ